MDKGKKLNALFWAFLKIGAVTFGGGYAMLALFENEFVQKRGWIQKEEFLDMIAVAESTPGPLAINGATYIGFRIAGVLGAVLATVAVCLPSFWIIFCLSHFLDRFLVLQWVSYAFNGIRIGVIYLIFSAGIKLFRGLPKNFGNYLLAGAVLVGMLAATLFSVSFSSVWVILFGAAVGLTAFFLQRLKKGAPKS